MFKRDDFLLRAMVEADLDLVLQWRNSPKVRQASYSEHEISSAEHRAWFTREKAKAESHLMIFQHQGRPVGVVNLTDIKPGQGRSVWGFYMGAEDAPRGCGSVMGFLALEYGFESAGLRKIVGEAMVSNRPSVRYHQRLGFSEEGHLVEHVLKDGVAEDVLTFAILSRDWPEIKVGLTKKLFAASGVV